MTFKKPIEGRCCCATMFMVK